ncbi:MAG: 16S rRNA (cytosine(1402)-N(4))-methyltransferase RsmH, partial [Pseudomonadota bacterium]
MRHIPVLLDEVAEVLAPQQGDVVVDGTFGAGGYTARLLATPVAHVHAIDRDPEAIAAGADLVAAHPGRLTLHQAPFSELAQIASEEVAAPIDAIVLDIGVSSMQLDQAERGFSFQKDGPLDMRMSLDGPSAADLVNTLDTATLARLLFVYGEEKKSRRIAAAIVARRAAKPFTRTSDLAALVAEVAPPLPRH